MADLPMCIRCRKRAADFSINVVVKDPPGVIPSLHRHACVGCLGHACVITYSDAVDICGDVTFALVIEALADLNPIGEQS